jgi:hypothetical protein
MLSEKIEDASAALTEYIRALSVARSYAVGDTETYLLLDQMVEKLHGTERNLHRLANEVNA